MEEQELMTAEPKQKNSIFKIVVAVVLTAVISVSASFFFFPKKTPADSTPVKYGKLEELQAIIDKHYYGEINAEELEKSMLLGYILGIGDKYANYLDASDSDERSETLSGNATGIGIIVALHPETGNLYVKNVYDNAPAMKAGLLVGDQIEKIDSVPVKETGYTKAVESIQREIGKTVDLTVLRGEKTLDLKVTYSAFVSQTVFYKLLDDGCGYVQIISFNGETPKQFSNAVNKLVAAGAKSLIFDVRGNGGGTVDSVTKMVDFLCPEGTIMTAKYADGTVETIATSDSVEVELPMAVLTDETTASASELFTASIKEFGKGISVGSKTYGKGVMQGTYTLSDGSTAVITIAEFFVHNDVSFNEKGISPDIPVYIKEEDLVYRHLWSVDEDPVISAAREHFNK